MKVNLDRGGIIWQARLHMGTADNVKPLNKDEGEFQAFGSEMTRARIGKNAPQSEVNASYQELADESAFNPIGRIVRKETDLPTGKRLNVNLALLNESVGIMPPYRSDEPDVSKIGRANFFLKNKEEHSHDNPQNPRYASILSAGFDILTDGSVNASSVSFEACNECLTVLLHDDSKIIGRLGLQAIYNNRLPVASHPFGPYSARTSKLHNVILDENQITGLQGFLAEQFQPAEQE